MRFLLFIFIACLLAHYCGAQNIIKDKAKTYLKKQIVPASLVFLSGMADGFVETISHNYPKFKAKFPNANDSYFSPAISFNRKYKNGDKAQGERFLGSTGPLVFLTDAFHLGRFVDHLFMAEAISFKITQGVKKKWYLYAAEIIGFWAANRLGFYAVYKSF